jgi:hypothetical protein
MKMMILMMIICIDIFTSESNKNDTNLIRTQNLGATGSLLMMLLKFG